MKKLFLIFLVVMPLISDGASVAVRRDEIANLVANQIVQSSQPAYSDPLPATTYSQWEHAGNILTNGDATDPALGRIHPASLYRVGDQIGLAYGFWTNKALTGPINEGVIKVAIATNLSQFNAGKRGTVVTATNLTSGTYTWVGGPNIKYFDGLYWMTCFAGTNSPATFEGETSNGMLLYSTNGITGWTEAPSSPYATAARRKEQDPTSVNAWNIRNIFLGRITKVDDLYYIHFITYANNPQGATNANQGIGNLHYVTTTNLLTGPWVANTNNIVFESDGTTIAWNLGGDGSIVWLPEQQKWLAQLGYQMATCTNRHPTNFVMQTSWLNTGLTEGSGWDQYWGFSLFEDDGLVGVWDSHPGPVAAEGGDFVRLVRPYVSAKPVRATTLTLGTTTISNFSEIQSSTNNATENQNSTVRSSTLLTEWEVHHVLVRTNGLGAIGVTDGNAAAYLKNGLIGVYFEVFTNGYSAGNRGQIEAAFGTRWDNLAKHGVVMSGTVAEWDSGQVFNPKLYWENGTNWMMYAGSTGTGHRSGTHSIGIAHSTDGTNWTKYASNPVISVGSGGTWNDASIWGGTIFKHNATYYSLVTANDGTHDTIGLYTAPAITGPWTEGASNPVIDVAGWTQDASIIPLAEGGYAAVLRNAGFFDAALSLPGWSYSLDLTNWSTPQAISFTNLTAVPLGQNQVNGNYVGMFCPFPIHDDRGYSIVMNDQENIFLLRPQLLGTSRYLGTFSGNGAGLTNINLSTSYLTNAAGSKFLLVVNTDTNGFTFTPIP